MTNELPWWGKILVGAGIVGLMAMICKYFGLSLLTLCQLFCYVVVVPVLVLAGMGIFSSGLLDAGLGIINANFDTIKGYWMDLVADAADKVSNPGPQSKTAKG